MADGVDVNTVTPGGPKIATDDISGQHYQRIKLIHGADGVNAGDVATGNPLPVVQTGTPALPTGAATEATLDVRTGALTETAPATDTASSGINGRLQRIAQRISSLIALIPAALTGSGNFKVALQESNASQAVTGTVTANAGTGTLAVSAASLPLPSGASTSAKQAALGTAGTASADVITVQGITSMTALKTDASATTQPVSGTVTANAGTNLNTSTLALESGGNLAAAAASLSVLDDWDESDRAKVNPIAGQAGVAGNTGTVSALTQRVVLATDVGLPAGTADLGLVHPLGYIVRCQTDVVRPADTTAYAANDAWSDSTSAPTSGGFTLTGAGRASGKGGIITDLIVVSSNVPGTLLQGELWIFNQAVTNINDNAAFTVSAADAKNFVGKIAFTLEANGAASMYHAMNLAIGFVCSGSANLRYVVKVKNAYTPASGETLTVAAKILQVD